MKSCVTVPHILPGTGAQSASLPPSHVARQISLYQRILESGVNGSLK